MCSTEIYIIKSIQVEREIHIAAADLRSANSHKTADMFSNMDGTYVAHISVYKAF